MYIPRISSHIILPLYWRDSWLTLILFKLLWSPSGDLQQLIKLTFICYFWSILLILIGFVKNQIKIKKIKSSFRRPRNQLINLIDAGSDLVNIWLIRYKYFSFIEHIINQIFQGRTYCWLNGLVSIEHIFNQQYIKLLPRHLLADLA